MVIIEIIKETSIIQKLLYFSNFIMFEKSLAMGIRVAVESEDWIKFLKVQPLHGLQ